MTQESDHTITDPNPGPLTKNQVLNQLNLRGLLIWRDMSGIRKEDERIRKVTFDELQRVYEYVDANWTCHADKDRLCPHLVDGACSREGEQLTLSKLVHRVEVAGLWIWGEIGSKGKARDIRQSTAAEMQALVTWLEKHWTCPHTSPAEPLTLAALQEVEA